MGCSSPFNAVSGHAVVDSSRHVNFTNGMVLGADDYIQEFAYHAARDQWICREALGTGTLCGLAVDVEADGDKGPRIRVSPGSAVAPSGQLICVGREQCGSLNGWLADSTNAAKVTALAAGLSPPTALDLTLFLNLCYTDCAVAPVPIPGEPCRSADALMQPSRIADDYILNFSFTAPPMAEVEAVALLDGFIAGLADDPTGGTDATTLAQLAARARLQLALALGATETVSNPADLDPIQVNPDLRPALLLAIRRLWVTRLRPLVMAQACGAAADPSSNCVLLAVLSVPVVKVGSVWEVKAGATPSDVLVSIDESRRPLLLAGNAAASRAASALSSATPARSLAFLTTSKSSPLTQGLVLIQSGSAISATLAAADPSNRGHLLELRNLGTATATLTADSATPTLRADSATRKAGTTKTSNTIRRGGTTKIGDSTSEALAPGGRITLRSDGAGTWQILNKTEGRA